MAHDVAPAAALAEAREADRLLWSTPSGDTGDGRRHARNHAVLRALQAGVPAEQLADGLGVLVVDVERMAAEVGDGR